MSLGLSCPSNSRKIGSGCVIHAAVMLDACSVIMPPTHERALLRTRGPSATVLRDKGTAILPPYFVGIGLGMELQELHLMDR